MGQVKKKTDKTVIFRSYEYHPHDIFVAFNAVVTQRFGPDAISSHKPHWYRPRKPLKYLAVKTSCTREVQVIVDGPLEIRGVPGYFMTDSEGNVNAEVPESHRAQTEELLMAVQKHLETKSIYRSKAITFSFEFMDLSGVDLDSLRYNEKVEDDLRAQLWTLIEHPDWCRKAGIARRRKVLLAGPFGSGKTMATLKTAAKAVVNGWTFLHIEPSLGPSTVIASALEFARKYQPAIVSIEDFDREQNEGNHYAIGHLMSAVDGALSKAAEIVVVMTTNYHDKIAAGLQRPGRLDRIIQFDKFNSQDIQRLLRLVIAPDMLTTDIDWDAVAKACEGYMPAFVREVGTSAKLTAISKQGDGTPLVTQPMLISAAHDLAAQHKVCTQETLGFKAE